MAAVRHSASSTSAIRPFTNIRERTRAVLDALPRNARFDWVDQVSTELTTMMLATLLDFPWAERRKLTYWSDVAICNINAPDAPVHSEEARFAELLRMADAFKRPWQERTKAPPRLDLISMMAHSAETRGLSAMEFVGYLTLLIAGGNDTTRNSMSGGLLALSQNPDQLTKLKANPGLVPSLVAETIRYQTPDIHMRRTATRDSELAGQHICRGDKVVMWYISGNCDESVIDQGPFHHRSGQAAPAPLVRRRYSPLRRRPTGGPAAADTLGRNPRPRPRHRGGRTAAAAVLQLHPGAAGPDRCMRRRATERSRLRSGSRSNVSPEN